AAQVEQIVLDTVQQRIDRGWQRSGAPQADGAVQLVHIAQGGDARGVLGDTGLVAQAGGAVVTGTGGYDGNADRHQGLLGGTASMSGISPGRPAGAGPRR